MTKRFLLSYLGLALFLVVVLEIPLGVAYSRNQYRDLTTKLERDATTFATLASTVIEGRPGISASTLAQSVRRYQRETGGRVTIVRRNGDAVVDSSSPGRDFPLRPEIQAALRGEVATGTRYSQALETSLAYVARPVAMGGVVHGAVRILYPRDTIDDRVLRFWLLLAAIGAIVLAAAFVLGLSLVRSITKPLRELERAVAAAGGGDLTVRAPRDVGPGEIRALSDRFNAMVHRLESLIKSQEEFLADAAHQLRTPLTALRLRLENLERAVPARDQASVEGAILELERLSRLVEGLLTLADADSSDVSPIPIDLAEAVRERLEAWSALAEESDVALLSSLDGRLYANATPGRVEQVLDNLLANALEVAPPGSAITVTGVQVGDRAELHVVDQGPGMSPEQRRRAFDRLWRARSGDRGFGLGLAIAKRLVTADGGDVDLVSAPGGGIDAVVRLRRTSPSVG